MATYPVKHKETGETKEIVMSVHEWDQWKADNPDWERYYTPENTPGVGEVGEWKDKCVNPNQGGMKCSVEHKKLVETVKN